MYFMLLKKIVGIRRGLMFSGLWGTVCGTYFYSILSTISGSHHVHGN